jgi:signal transduction histidine kinase
MILDALQIELLASGLSFFISSLVLILLFINNRKEPIVQAFFFGLSSMVIWSGTKTLSYLTGDIEIARILRIISVSFIPLIAAGFYWFTVAFYEKAQKNKASVFLKYRKFINYSAAVIVLALISDLFWSTDLIIGEMRPHPVLKFSPVPGTFWITLVIYFFTVAAYSGFIVYKSKKGAPILVKQQANWITWTMSIALIAGGGGFAAWYNIPGSSIISIFAAPIFTIGIFYSITRHGLFNMKTTAAELITFSIWGFLFFRVIFAKTLHEQITEGILLFIVILLGILLIESVFKEVSQKEELEKIARKLTNLNKTLEQKVQERTVEISRSKKHMETIIENLTLGLIEHDGLFKVFRMNTAAENILNVNRTNVINKIIPAEQKSKEYLALSNILYLPKSENIKEIHLRINNKNVKLHEITLQYPSKKILEVTTVPFISDSPNSSNKKYIKLIRDITWEKEIDEAKSSFISIAAHQLRTPLSAIKWVFALALSGNLGKLTEMQEEMFKKGSKSNENMIHIVNDLLDVSRIEKGSYAYDLKKNDITTLINEIIETSKFTMKEKNLTFKINTPEIPIPQFTFDRERMKIALQNILDNATTYTPSDGEIKISTLQKNNSIIIKVEDNGIGISQEDLKKVFTKFFRSKKAVHIETDRTGLGLFIAKEIINAHNGEITLESEEGKGTTVTITLPTNKAAQNTTK